MTLSHPARTLPVLALLCNAFVWGMSWWPFRQLEAAGLHPLWATATVYGAVVVAFGGLRPGALRGMLRSPALWVLATAAGCTNTAFNWGVTVGDVVRVVLLFYLMPLWSLGLSWWLLGDRPTPAALGRVLLALAGAALVLWPADGGWPLPQSPADLLGLAGGMGFALTNVLLRRLGEGDAGPRAMAMFVGGMAVSAVVATGLTGAGVLGAPLPQAALSAAGVLLVLGFFAGNLALQYGAARLPAQLTALVMLAEIVFAALSAWLAGVAQLEARLLAGGALILCAGVLTARAQPKGAGATNMDHPIERGAP